MDFNLAIITIFVLIISFILWKLGEKSSSKTVSHYVIGDEWNRRIIVFRNKQNRKDTLNEKGITSLCMDVRKCQNKRSIRILNSLSKEDGSVDVTRIKKYINRYPAESDIVWLRIDNENLLAADEFEIFDEAYPECSGLYINKTKLPTSIEKISDNMGVQKMGIVVSGSLRLTIEEKGNSKSIEMKQGNAFTWDDTFRHKIETLGECIYILFDVPRVLGGYEATNLELIDKHRGSLTRFQEDLDNEYISLLYRT